MDRPLRSTGAVILEGSTLSPSTSTKGIGEQLHDILAMFQAKVQGVVGLAIADKNGLPIASLFPQGVDFLTVCAMSTMAVQSSMSVFSNLGLAGLDHIELQGRESAILIQVLRESGSSLLAVVTSQMNLGLLRIELQRAAREIEETLEF